MTCVSRTLHGSEFSSAHLKKLKGVKVDCSYRIDFVVDDVVLEIKSVAAIEPIHEAQVLTYMKLGQWKLGLLINFNVALLASGIRRLIL
ncbi:MAG TPA: GxxExxY protein [Thermoanaerobaculia bacterium]|nr:GxxExxY protein [Thermoanaerobaculia bacterium]